MRQTARRVSLLVAGIAFGVLTLLVLLGTRRIEIAWQLRRLDSNDPVVRDAAIERLVVLRAPEAIEPFVRLLPDDAPALERRLIHMLNSSRLKVPPLDFDTDPDPGHDPLSHFRDLARLGVPPDRLRLELLTLLEHGVLDPIHRAYALIALVTLGDPGSDDRALAPRLRSRLREDTAVVRLAAAFALSTQELETEQLPGALEEIFASTVDERIARIAGLELGLTRGELARPRRVQPVRTDADERARDMARSTMNSALGALLRHPGINPAIVAGLLEGRLAGDPIGLGYLVAQRLTSGPGAPIDVYTEVLGDISPRIVETLAKALAIATEAEELTVLLDALRRCSSRVPPLDEPAIERVVSLLESRIDDVRAAASELLATRTTFWWLDPRREAAAAICLARAANAASEAEIDLTPEALAALIRRQGPRVPVLLESLERRISRDGIATHAPLVRALGDLAACLYVPVLESLPRSSLREARTSFELTAACERRELEKLLASSDTDLRVRAREELSERFPSEPVVVARRLETPVSDPMRRAQLRLRTIQRAWAESYSDERSQHDLVLEALRWLPDAGEEALEITPALEEFLSVRWWSARGPYTRALALVDADDPHVAELVANDLEDDSERLDAIASLRITGASALPLVSQLLPLTRDPDHRMRHDAVRLLGELAPDDDALVRTLGGTLDDPHPSVRAASALALGDLLGDFPQQRDATIEAALKRHLEDPDARVRSECARALRVR